MDQLLEIVTTYGYIALYGLLALGIVGLPVPDETLMVLTGSLVSLGTFRFATAAAVCFAGSMTGMTVSYLIGRKLGKPVMYRYGRWVRLTPKRLELAEGWFQKYGLWTVAFGFFVPGVRHFTCYLSGLSGIRMWRYLTVAGIGAVIWCICFITIGYYVGENWESIIGVVHKYMGISAVVLIALAGLTALLVARYRRRNAS